MGEFRADIEADPEIIFIRQHQKVMTGQKSYSEVDTEINSRVAKIKSLFNNALQKTNKKLEEIKRIHDGQIIEIFDLLKSIITELENSGVFEYGEYKFTNSVLWKMNFANIDSSSFASDLKKKVVGCSTTTKKVQNKKKDEWRTSWNPLKKIGSLFMDDYEIVTVNIDGHYETTDIRKHIDNYLHDFERESSTMEKSFKDIMEKSKEQVRDLTGKLLREITQFLEDIKKQEEKIKKLGNSISMLNEEIKRSEETHLWLNNLREKIEVGK